MAFKKWFPGREKKVESAEARLTIDDMIELQQYEEAEDLLRAKIKANHNDLHSQLKLADLYRRSGRGAKAVDEYISVADAYAADGFFDKATALLRKVAKLAPGHEKVPLKIEALRRAKRLNHRREVVIEALQSGTKAGRTVSAFKVQRMWRELSGCPLIERLEEDRLRRLFESLDLVQISPGEILAEKNERMEKMFVIAEGMVEAVAVLPNGTETAIRGFGPGQMIGDRALLEHQPWPTVYRASEDCFVLELDKEGLAQALRGDPDPRHFLDALREQRNDQEVVWSVQKLERS
jgi:CRP-like cAMP-binding protein